MRRGMIDGVAVWSIAMAGAAGCASTSGTRPARPAPINHPVFFDLVDDADAPELIADCDARIATIPGVVSYYCGTPFDSGRDSVDRAYDVGLSVGFASAADYASYVAHSNHVALVRTWAPRLESLLVRDVIDDTP